MIIEFEVLEQVAEASFDWTLADALKFVGEHKDPWPVLRSLFRDHCLIFQGDDGHLLPDWKVEEMCRNQDASFATKVIVKVTGAGIKRANY